MTTSPKVTALVPAYQSAEFIRPTLDSLAAQTCPDFTVIISVDRCDDETYPICTDYAARDSRFRVFRHDSRLGYVGNCNFLLGQAHADYVLFAFHDDILAPDYVEKLVRLLDSRPDAVMAYSDLSLTHVDGSCEQIDFNGLDGMDDPVRRGRAMLQPVRDWWVPNRGVFRRRDACRIGGLKTHGAGEFSADWPWLFHMSLLGSFVRCPEVLCFKYYKTGSLSRSWEFSKRQHYEVALSCLRELRHSDLTILDKIAVGQPLLRRLMKIRRKMWKHALLQRLGLRSRGAA